MAKTSVANAIVRITSEGGARVSAELKALNQELIKLGKADLAAGFSRAEEELRRLQQDIILHAAPESQLRDRWNKITGQIFREMKTLHDPKNGLYTQEQYEADSQRIKELNKEITNLEKQNQKIKTSSSIGNFLTDKDKKYARGSGKYSIHDAKEYLAAAKKEFKREGIKWDEKTMGSTDSIEGMRRILKTYEELNTKTLQLTTNDKKLLSAINAIVNAYDKQHQNAKELINDNKEQITKEKENIEILKEKTKAYQANEEALENVQGLASNIKSDIVGVQTGQTTTEDTSNIRPELLDRINKETQNITESWKELNAQQKQNEATADRLTQRYLSFYAAFRLIKRGIHEVYNTIKQLDAAFNEIAVVTQYSTKEVWGMYDAFVSIANQTGKTAEEIIHVAGAYFKQGKSYQEVLTLTKAAAMAASVAGISAEESVRYLTAALNGYNLSATKAMDVSDKFAKLAANSATNYEDLAIALSKVAAQASSSGVAMDSLLGFMTAALEVTQEAPENIGTAFKTILARMTNLTDYGKVLEDNTSANAVAKALNTINVSLFDQEGQIRNLDEVLIEVGYQWENLDSVQQRYLATALAGTRQQTRLMAVFNDFERTMELVEISQDSAGTTMLQQSKRMEGLEYHLTQLKTAWQAFIADLGSADLIKGVVDMLTGIVNLLTTIGSKNTVLIASIGMLTITLGKIPDILSTVNIIFNKLKTNVSAAHTVLTNWKDVMNKVADQTWKVNAIQQVSSKIKALHLDVDKEAYATSLLELAVEEKKKGCTEEELIKKLTNLATEKNITKEDAEQLALTTAKAVEEKAAARARLVALSWVAAALAAIAIVVAVITNHTKKLKEETTNLYKEFNKIKDTSKNIQKLAKQYKTLQNTIGKTTDQMEEMESIQQQILDADPDANFIDAFGHLDEKAYNEYLKNLENKSNETINKTYDNALERSKSTFAKIKKEYYKTEDELTKKALEMAQAIKIAGEDSEGMSKYAQYLEDGNKEAISLLDTIGKLSLKNIKVLDQEQYSRALLRAQREDPNFEDHQEAIEKNLKEAGSSSKTVEEILGEDRLKEFTKQLLENGYENGVEWVNYFAKGATAQTEEALTAILKSLGGPYTTIVEIKSRFDNIETLEQAIDFVQHYIDNNLNINPFLAAFDKAKDMNSEDFKTILDEIASDFDTLDEIASNGVDNLVERLQGMGIETQTIIPFVTELINQFFNIPDIDASLSGIRNGTANLKEFNSALQDGTFSYDQLVQYLMEYPELSDEIVNSILKTGYISEEVTNKMLAYDKKQFEASIEAKQAELQAQMSIIDKQLEYEEAKLKAIMDGNEAEYNHFVKLQEEELQVFVNSLTQQVSAYDQAAKYMRRIDNQEDVGEIKIKVDTVGGAWNSEENKKAIQQAINSLKAQRANYQAQYDALEVLKDKQDSIYGSAVGGIDSASDAAKEYERQLNKIYIIEQKLAALNKTMSLVDALKSLYKDRDGLEYKYLLDTEEELIQKQTDAYKELIDVQKEEQQALLSAAGSMNGAYTIINGRMVPVMDKYLQLTDEEAESLDKLTEEYNKYSDSIADNTINLVKNEEALKKIQEERRNAVIETQKILIAAIKEEQKQIYEEEKKRLEKEKELLNKRKEMYQEAFKEEDYQNELSDIDTKRQNIINQLNQLAGANDAKSKEKRQSLLEELDSINKEYNDKTTEYNRNALLEQIDDEIDANDKAKTELQTNYEERINDYAWLEEQITILTSKGVEDCMAYLRKWHTDYKDATTEMREKVEQEWQALFDSVYGQYDKNILESAKMLSTIEAQNKATTDNLINMWNSVAAAQNSSGSLNSGSSNQPVKYQYTDRQGRTYSNLTEAEAMIKARDDITNVRSATSVAQQIELNKKRIVKYYSKGGYVPYTGLAMVHGTTNNPEAFLSAKDTANFEALKLSLDRAYSKNDTVLGGDIIIQGINIETTQLNTEQDWYRSGKQFGTALQAALRERGLVSNIKK